MAGCEVWSAFPCVRGQRTAVSIPARLPIVQQRKGFASNASAYPPVSATARNVQSTEQTSARTIVVTDRINAFRWANHRPSTFAERRTRKQNGRVQKAIAKYSCDFQPGRMKRSSSQNVSTLAVRVT